MDVMTTSISGQRQQSVGSVAGSNAANRNSGSTTNTTTINAPGQSQADKAAAASLQLLLREDPLLTEHGLTLAGSNSEDKAAFAYAAALLLEQQQQDLNNQRQQQQQRPDVTNAAAQQRADLALQDVERKLALVESLAVRLSRTSPEAVAGHLLRLHGYQVAFENAAASLSDPQSGESNRPDGGTTLTAIRDRADRLERQAQVLDNVARRVEGTLTRGLTRMEASCMRLERVLQLSNTLKMMMRLQFEHQKLESYDLDDVRDLTRAAASVAVIEDLLKKPEFQAVPRIGVVEVLKPSAIRIAAAVRQSAALMLQRQCQSNAALPQLAATLEVYYHLGELSQAVWKAVDLAHAQTERVCRDLWNPVSIASMTDQARATAKDSRSVAKKLKEIQTTAAETWALGMYDAATQVRNLNSVLTRKTDPVRRQLLIDVVKAEPVPQAYRNSATDTSSKDFSLFALFWGRVAVSLGQIVDTMLSQDNGKYKDDVASLYPAIRASSKELIRSVHQETIPMALDDWSTPTVGILGGSAILNDEFLDWATGEDFAAENPQSAADTWTQVTSSSRSSTLGLSQRNLVSTSSNITMASFITSTEWKTLAGNKSNCRGLYPLEKAFVNACTDRLCSPLQYMFPENVTVDDDGVAVASGLSLLPSKYDVQRFDENIRQELLLADPREGGDATIVTMIAACVVTMIGRFCVQAKNALSGTLDSDLLLDNFTMSEGLQHDRKIAVIMFTLAKYLSAAPDKAFVDPYASSSAPLQEETAKMCRESLKVALQDIDHMVQVSILVPLSKSINRKICSTLSRMHASSYSDSESESPEFVQRHLSPVYESVNDKVLSKFPPTYANHVSALVASYTIHAFNTNAVLLQPMNENARLHITQDLADLELALSQFVAKFQLSTTLVQLKNGIPYAELRAMRQMLFWSDLDDKSKTGLAIAKSLLKEPWLKDIRVFTVLDYLFTYGPSLLPTPYHYMKINVQQYANKMIKLDGSTTSNESNMWLTVMSCCDLYQQRASSASQSILDGDTRVPEIILTVGQELMKRQQHQ